MQVDPAAWHGGITSRPLPVSAGDSDADFAFIQQNLQECLKAHPYCEENSTTYLPTRVLNIGSSGEPCLLETEGIRGRYITLSHCWGGKVSLTTTTDNLSAHKKAIPLASMPPTFRQAVHISKRLGIQYLWIDSLCILQNSKDDWEREASKMGDVYKGSYLTIAARAASSAEVGCFIARREASTCRIEYQSPDRSLSGSIYILDPAFQLERITETPLDTRGWVLQERILSPRILHYGAQQIYWECREATIRQDGKYPDINQDNLRLHGFKQSLDVHVPCDQIFYANNLRPREWTPQKFDLYARMAQWYCLVSMYSVRKLTFGSDKLPAIAGIAKTAAAFTGYSYIAGLWREDILAGLLWYRAGIEGSNEPLASLKLPSWSWARFNGRIEFRGGKPNGTVRIVDDSCQAIDINYRSTGVLGNYGEVCHSRIELRGKVIAVTCRTVGDSDDTLHPGEYLFDASGTQIGKMIRDHNRDYTQSQELFSLLIHAGEYPAGLALERVQGQNSTFERVGFIPLYINDFQQGKYIRALFQNTNPSTVYII